MDPGLIGSLAPPGEDWLGRRLADLERRVSAQTTARTLESASVGKGGIVFPPPLGGTIRMSAINDPATGGTIAFTPIAAPALAARITGYDPDPVKTGAHAAIALRSTFDNGNKAEVLVDVVNGSGIYATRPDGSRGGITMTPDSAQIQVVTSSTAALLTAYSHPVGNKFGDAYYNCGLQFESDGAISAIQGIGNTGSTSYTRLKASAFTVSSSRDVKDMIGDGALPFDSLDVVRDAPANWWRYKPEHADTAPHAGPIAEQLPDDLVYTGTDGTRSVDLLSLVGVLWDAVGKLTARIEQLEGAVA